MRWVRGVLGWVSGMGERGREGRGGGSPAIHLAPSLFLNRFSPFPSTGFLPSPSTDSLSSPSTGSFLPSNRFSPFPFNRFSSFPSTGSLPSPSIASLSSPSTGSLPTLYTHFLSSASTRFLSIGIFLLRLC